jgi:hypothetical protein
MNAIPKTLVSREHLGQARLLLNRMRAEEHATDQVVKAAIAPVFDRLIKHPERRLRDGTFRAAVAGWQAAPNAFRLQFHSKVEPRGRWGHASEVRLGTTRVKRNIWAEGDWEMGTTIGYLEFTCPAKPLLLPRLHYRPVCNISIHALARRYERGGPVTDADLVAEMRGLGESFFGACDEAEIDDTLRVTVTAGVWSGDFSLLEDPDDEAADRLVLFVRTFLPPSLS